MEISKELLSEILNVEISEVNGTLTHKNNKSLLSYITKNCSINEGKELINIYELAHKNLKQWAKLKNVFDIIDWSEEPEQIFKKVEEIRKINEKQLQH